jgi:A/G-specific adenine glycosylase
MSVDMSAQIAPKILAYFSTNARQLPWRNPPGQVLPLGDPDWPYRVWLSEVMLQQTVAATVIPYFEAFTARWPTVEALAAADDADVMSAWAGLGYYARARNLLACARTVAAAGGRFPEDEAALRELPGVGGYTAAAIAAFAFAKRAVVVDGNIERVVARLFAIGTPLPAAREAIYAAMDKITPHERAGDVAQGLMDLARGLCTPRNPKCLLCPLTAICQGKTNAETYPVRAIKNRRPERFGTAWWIECDGEVLLVRRPGKGLLGGMRALPSDGWATSGVRQVATQDPFAGDWQVCGGVRHVFTHFSLTLTIRAVWLKRGCKPQLEGEWWRIDEIDDAGLPSLFVKAASRVIAQERVL